MTTAAPEVSHGRGGAGNINPDDVQYVDGEVVRAGVPGSHGDGAFSTGRGGAANIGDPGVKSVVRKDLDLVPDVATRPSQDNSDRHVGRGGAGNSIHVGEKAESTKGPVATPATLDDTPTGLADKLKGKIFHIFKK